MGWFSKAKPSRDPKRSGGLSKTNLTNYYKSEQRPTASPFKHPLSKKNYSKWLYGMLDIFIIGGLLALFIYSLVLTPKPKIIVNDATYHSADKYAQAVAQSAAGLADRNKITFNEKEISQALQAKYPEISQVKVELPFFSHTPIYRISIAKPTFRINSMGKTYVVNASGVVVAPLAQLPKAKDLPLINDQSGYSLKVGSQVISQSAVDFMATVVAQAQRAKVPLSSIDLPPALQEINLRTADRGYYTKFHVAGDAQLQAGQFLAARHQFDQNNLQPNEYLDVRVAGKIFYK